MIDDTTRDAERQVIGAVLASPRALDEVIDHITPADLWDPRHALILEAALEVQKNGHPVEPVTVADQLGGEVRRAGGSAYLFELHGAVINASSAGYLAETVLRRASITRRVVEVGTRLAALAASDSDPLEVVNAVRHDLDNIAVGKPETTTVEHDVYAAIESLEEAAGLPTPWRDLTEVLGGWRPGALYYLGARPGVGKSTVALEAVIDMARRERQVLLCSLEMSKQELYLKMLSNVGSVDNKRLMHRNLNEKDYERLARAAKHIAGLPLHVDESGQQTVADIRARARSIIREHGNLGLIVVDYLQLMSSGHRVESRQQEVSGFSRSLKLLAKELNVPVLALSQLNRGSEVRHDKRPSLSDMRESGSLEQDGDGVLLLHRDRDDPTGIEMVVAKNRHGPADKAIRLEWSGSFSRVSDVLPTHRF